MTSGVKHAVCAPVRARTSDAPQLDRLCPDEFPLWVGVAAQPVLYPRVTGSLNRRTAKLAVRAWPERAVGERDRWLGVSSLKHGRAGEQSGRFDQLGFVGEDHCLDTVA